MQIDDFLPIYHVTERHAIVVRAPAKAIYAAISSLDMSASPIIRTLFRLRGLPPSTLTLRGMEKVGFTVLGEVPEQELLLGVIGRFWTPVGGLQRIDATRFRSFDKPGYAKAAWNFALVPQPDGTVRVTTETRVLCTDDASRKHFRLYWRLVGPFSAWIRREMLRIVKQQAEQAAV